jgi:hypothetical protein
MARLRHTLKPSLDLRTMGRDDNGAEPNGNAESLLIDLFRQALTGDADAIDAIHTVVDQLGPPRDKIIFVIEE